MRNKNFTARITTRAGIVIESTPRKTFGETERWITRTIEDCPNIMGAGIFSIKIIHVPTHTFFAGHYTPSKKKLKVWRPYSN